MDWKMQLGISIIVPIISSVLTYLAAMSKSKNDIEVVKINAKNEIDKIKEESQKEIEKIELEYQKQTEKMKIETDEQIRLKIAEHDLDNKGNEEKLKNEVTSKFFDDFMKNPQKGMQNLSQLMKFSDALKDMQEKK